MTHYDPYGEMASKMKNKAPQKEKRGTSHGEKNTHSFVVSRGAPRSECDYIKCTMFPEIIHHIIISKYTLECTQLKFLLKNFSEKHTLESSSRLAIKLNIVIRTARSTTQARCITIPP